VREGLRLACLGLALGLACAFGVTRLMQRMLFDVSATDPLIFGGVAVFLGIVATLACLIPALRATRVDPMTALRAE
jgi:putative ABC transport system permease protein